MRGIDYKHKDMIEIKSHERNKKISRFKIVRESKIRRNKKKIGHETSEAMNRRKLVCGSLTIWLNYQHSHL